MRIQFSVPLVCTAVDIVQATLARKDILDVARTAREIQRKNPQDQVALEDIETLILRVANDFHSPMYLDHLKVRRENGTNVSRTTVESLPADIAKLNS